MKKGIHPTFYKTAKITDNSSGKVLVVGSTVQVMTVEISSLTHPFYTGKQRIVDTDNLVEKFEERRKRVNKKAVSNKRAKQEARRSSGVKSIEKREALTLKDMLRQLK